MLEGILDKDQEKNLTEDKRKYLPKFKKQSIKLFPLIRDKLKEVKEKIVQKFGENKIIQNVGESKYQIDYKIYLKKRICNVIITCT